jgi:large subunit ribosomal protein L10
MSLNLEQKQAVVAEVSDALSSATTAILAEYRGLTVAQMTELRARARESNVFLRVIKNTLARRVVEGSQFECLKNHLVGPVAFAASADPVSVAKVLKEFAKNNEHLVIKAGVMDGKAISLEEVTALASLPSRNELLAKLLGTMQAPIQKFVQTLNEVPTSFVRALAAVRDSKQEAAS